MNTRTYDVRNPTLAARVIWDGFKNDKPIRIAPGETLRGLVLADHVVETLRRDAALGPNADLEVTPAAKKAAPEPPAATGTYAPGQYAPPNPSVVPQDAPEAPGATPDTSAPERATSAPLRGRKKRA